MNRRTGLILGLLGFLQVMSPVFPGAVYAQDCEAKKLFQEALTLKTAGNAEKAALTFREAVTKDRSILSENDNGLIENLRSHYAEKLEANGSDPDAVEGMGFVAANCDGDFPAALTHYTKALSLTTDDAAKTRLTGIIDGLKAQTGAPSSPPAGASTRPGAATGTGTNTAGDNPELAASKAEAEAAKAEAEAKRDGEITNLTRSKEDLEARLPRLESEIKTLEDENERNHRMYLSTNDRRYKRKEDAGESSIEAKKKEMDRVRGEMDRIEKKIDGLTSREPEKAKPEGGE
jgi:tetratricopeptide (TPR) repeat protein